MAKTVKVYEWVKSRNWGDRLTGVLLRGLEMTPVWAPVSEADLVVVGSILEHLPNWWHGTVAGAGKMFPHSNVNLTHATVLGLRGRLTAESCRGVPDDIVLGDPALLTPRWVPQQYTKYDLGILPHWSDHELKDKYPQGYFIDPAGDPKHVATEITRCRRLITSGLHGVILADAYGIPRQSELFPQAVDEGEDFKFRDYASVFEGPDPHFGEMYTRDYADVERVQTNLLRMLEQIKAEAIVPDPVPDPRTPIVRTRRWPQISVLVPFRDDNEHRRRVWDWLRRYWLVNLESVEIIQGHYSGWPFYKTQAVNQAASRARGRVFVIADCDAYIDTDTIQALADNIDAAVAEHRRLWYMPYSMLYRIRQEPTLKLLRRDPRRPYQITSPPPEQWVEPDNAANYGHKFGALMQVMPREAFYLVGGMDGRFNKGWGSEDASMMRAVDTLYQEHEVVTGDICHLWHVRPGSDWRTRHWVGQPASAPGVGVPLPRLAQRYSYATSEPTFMAGLIGEHEPARENWESAWAWLYRRGGWPGCRMKWLRDEP